MYIVDVQVLADVRKALDDLARRCVKLIHRNGLSEHTRKRLANFLYGLVNQKLTISSRVKLRGPSEFEKVLKYAAKAWEVIQKADVELQTETEE